MDLIVGTGKMRLIKWGNYFKFEKGLAITSRIYQLKYLLTPTSWPCAFWCFHMHFSSHSQSLCLWRATYCSRPSWGDELLQLAETSFSQGVTISSPTLEESSFTLFFMLPHLGLVVGLAGQVIQLWPQHPVGHEHLCFSPLLKLARCFTSRLVLKFTQATTEYTQEILAFTGSSISAIIISCPFRPLRLTLVLMLWVSFFLILYEGLWKISLYTSLSPPLFPNFTTYQA